MNRFIKIALIFLAIIGIIVGIQFIETDNGDTLEEDADVELPTTFAELGDTFYEEWEEETGWNKQLFNSQFEVLDHKLRAGNLTQSQHDRLAENICTYAINKTETALINQWSESDCDRTYIDKHYEGVTEINKKPYIKGDSRIIALQRIKDNYDKIYSFIDYTLKHKTFRAEAIVERNYSWDSFSTTAMYVKLKADKYMELQDYVNYFSKIDYIKTNLSNTDMFVKSAANHYYRSIVIGLRSLFTEAWEQKVADKDSTGLKELTQIMISKEIQQELRNDCVRHSSSQFSVYNDYVHQKKYELEELLEQWREESKTPDIIF